MINYIVGFICGVIITLVITSIGINGMIIGTIDMSDERLKNHAIQMKIDRIPYNLEKRHYIVFRVFHMEDYDENAT